MSKKITMNLKWVAWMLWGMGVLFIGVGVIVCAVVARDASMSPDDVAVFRAVFLGTFGGVGAILAIAGTIVYSRMARRDRMRERLISEGNYALATIMDVSVNFSVQINNRSPFVLRCQYKHDDGNTYIFKSGNLRFNPQSLLPENQVKVWIDRNDIKNYYVDVDASMQGGYIEL